MKQRERLIFSGITPTAQLTLGHYLAIIKPLLAQAKQFPEQKITWIFMLADWHALTLPAQQIDYQFNCQQITAWILAAAEQAGCPVSAVKVFRQSQIAQHQQLALLLSAHVSVASLQQMIQFKQKTVGTESANLALLSYPVLMAADILLYTVDEVWVGLDQAQHCELTRRLAAKFNRFLGQQLLRSPRISFSPYVLRDLRNPRAYKMSKSRPHGALLLSASQATIARQIQQAPTDSYQSLRYDPVQQPELANLLQIMAALQATSPEQIANTYQQSNYFQFKQALISNLQTELAALQVRQRQWLEQARDLWERDRVFLQSRAEQLCRSIYQVLRWQS